MFVDVDDEDFVIFDTVGAVAGPDAEISQLAPPERQVALQREGRPIPFL
ncbi:MAG TPA: hypothetical protein VFS37_06275 [Conexibacter sp.]|nr:hypothetical protein [Conexibacter sp.]